VTDRPWTLTWDRLLVEPRRPEVIRERTNAHWYAVAAVCVGAFMGQLDASIVTDGSRTVPRFAYRRIRGCDAASNLSR
jgi:hypothetical protein